MQLKHTYTRSFLDQELLSPAMSYLCTKQTSATGQTVAVLVVFLVLDFFCYGESMKMLSGKHETKRLCQFVIRVTISKQYWYFFCLPVLFTISWPYYPHKSCYTYYRRVQKMPGGLGMIYAIYQNVYLQNVVQYNNPGYILTDSCAYQSGHTSIWRKGWTEGRRVSAILCIDVILFALCSIRWFPENPVAKHFQGSWKFCCTTAWEFSHFSVHGWQPSVISKGWSL